MSTVKGTDRIDTDEATAFRNALLGGPTANLGAESMIDNQPIVELLEVVTEYDLTATNSAATIIAARAGKAFIINSLVQVCTGAGGSVSVGGSITLKDSAGNTIRTSTAVTTATNVVGRSTVLTANAIQIVTSGNITFESVAATGSGLIARASYKFFGSWVDA